MRAVTKCGSHALSKGASVGRTEVGAVVHPDGPDPDAPILCTRSVLTVLFIAEFNYPFFFFFFFFYK
jgi:hypothetical protein